MVWFLDGHNHIGRFSNLHQCTFKYYITCVSTAEFYQQMPQSNHSSENDLTVLLDWDWLRFMNKLSLIKSPNLFGFEARISK